MMKKTNKGNNKSIPYLPPIFVFLLLLPLSFVLFNISFAENETTNETDTNWTDINWTNITLDDLSFMGRLKSYFEEATFDFDTSTMGNAILSVITIPKKFVFEPLLRAVSPTSPDWLIDLSIIVITLLLLLIVINRFQTFSQTYVLKGLIIVTCVLLFMILYYSM